MKLKDITPGQYYFTNAALFTGKAIALHTDNLVTRRTALSGASSFEIAPTRIATSAMFLTTGVLCLDTNKPGVDVDDATLADLDRLIGEGDFDAVLRITKPLGRLCIASPRSMDRV